MAHMLARFCVVVGIGLAIEGVASAAPASHDDVAAAEAAFEDARRLMTAGRLSEACPKFAESQRLDPAIGTLLWLAQCYEKNGQTASAWAAFHEAEETAAKKNDARGKIAHQGVARLEPKLSKLVISVPKTADVSGLEVKRDGTIVGRALWGTPVPTDPGKHTVSASAPGKQPWDTTAEVPKRGSTISVTVPALDDEPTPAPEDTPVPDKPSRPIDTPPPDLHRGDDMRTVGIVFTAIGGTAMVVGLVFGAIMLNDKNQAQAGGCPLSSQCASNLPGYQKWKDANTSATIATFSFFPGAAALAGGLALYFLAPKSRAPEKSGAVVAPSVAPGAAGFVVRGSF